MATAGETLLSLSSLASGATAAQHLNSITTGTGGGVIGGTISLAINDSMSIDATAGQTMALDIVDEFTLQVADVATMDVNNSLTLRGNQ